MSTLYNPKVTTDGLVLYLDAANARSYPGSGTTWSDLSGNNNSCTLVNGPTFSVANNGTIVFDGVNDYGQVANNTNLNGSSMTISLWFRYTTIPSTTGILISKADTVGSFNGYTLGIDTGAQLFTDFKGASGGASTVLVGVIATNTWYHTVLTYTSGGQSIMYLNGIFAGSNTIPSFTTSTQPLRLMDAVDTFWGIIQGSIGSVQIYNRVLTNQEVLQNFNVTRSRFGV